MTRRRLAALTAVALLALTAAPALAKRPKAERPRVEMVFVLDTTGSMGGLIEGAKQKIWSIVNEVARGKPTPEVRIGLVPYRDEGDAYVTKVIQLTSDLDAAYKELMGFTADGGGDGPENVNRALSDALRKIEWSGKDVRALRVIFLVGDAPPHMDYPDVPSYRQTVAEARQRGVVVNAVRCGTWGETGAAWSEIASLGGGEFLTIDQSGGMVAVATPFDARLAELSRKLDATYVVTGGKAERKKAKRALDEAAGTAARGGAFASAERAAYRAKAPAAAPAAAARADLVGAMEEDAEGAEKTLRDTDRLPDEMQTMTLAERKAYLAKKAKEREAIRAELDRLARQRSDFLAKKAGESKDGFDAKVVDIVRSQATEAAGIAY